MAEAFNQDLTGVAVPRGAESFGRARLQRPQAEVGGLAGFINIGSTIFAGALKIQEDSRSRGLKKEVAEGIADSLTKLRKFKEAGGQGGNGSQQFNLRLMALSKELQVRGIDSEDINAAFRDEGFLPPKAALFEEIANEENREEAAQAAREEEAIDTAFEQGVAVPDKFGNIDREATLDLIKSQVQAATAQAQIMAGLGVVRKPSGEFSETARFRYFQKRPELRKLVFRQLLVGLRAPVNKLTTLLRVATPADVGEIKKQMLDVTDLADKFRLGQVRLSVGLTGPERDDHLAFVDSLLLSMSGSALNIQDAKDLSSLKAIAATMDFANKNMGILNIEDLPTLAAISLMSTQMGAAFASVALGQDDIRAKIQRQVSEELIRFGERKTPIADFTPPPNPKPSDLSELGADEAKHSVEDQLGRIQKSIDLQDEFQKKNIRVQKAPDAYSWLAIQGPLFNARDQLTANDKKAVAKVMTHPNYLANLQASEEFFSEKAAAVGAFSFDMVQQDLQTNVRELSNVAGFGTQGRDFDVKFNSVTKKFEVVDLNPLGAARRPGAGPLVGGKSFADVPAIQKRLERINKDVDFMLKTRQFKDTNQGGTEVDFIADVQALISGSEAVGVGQQVAGAPDTPNVQTATNITLEDLQPEILSVIDLAAPLFETLNVPLVITSTTKGKHKKGSKHLVGQAIDIRSRQLAGKNQKKMVNDLTDALGPDYDVVLESDHIHIEFDPKEAK